MNRFSFINLIIQLSLTIKKDKDKNLIDYRIRKNKRANQEISGKHI